MSLIFFGSQNAGQNCIGIERILVHESQYNEVYSMMLERAKELRMGSALSKPSDGMLPVVDMGAMISGDRFRVIGNILEAAERQGAVIEYRGQPYRHQYLETAQYFTPTVVGNVTQDMDIAQKESKWYCVFVVCFCVEFVISCSVCPDCLNNEISNNRRSDCDC